MFLCWRLRRDVALFGYIVDNDDPGCDFDRTPVRMEDDKRSGHLYACPVLHFLDAGHFTKLRDDS